MRWFWQKEKQEIAPDAPRRTYTPIVTYGEYIRKRQCPSCSHLRGLYTDAFCPRCGEQAEGRVVVVRERIEHDESGYRTVSWIPRGGEGLVDAAEREPKRENY